MAVKKHTFLDLVRIEQLRNIEAGKGEDLSYASIANMDRRANNDFDYSTFIQRLKIRARHLIQDNVLIHALLHPQKQFLRASRISLVIAAILGILAAGNAVGESDSLNIYWLLVVLLGFNLLSILLWIIGITLNMQGLSAGVAAQLVSWFPYRNKEKDTIESLASRAWWQSCLTGRIGKWRISVLTHKFWLTYLGSGLVILILLMIARQYNFIWGTTLLSENSLPEFTQFLARPMAYLGLITPDINQIAVSRIGIGAQDAETRTAWASFLIGAVLLYGILPRLALLAISTVMQKWAERKFKLDLYLPYYIELRQRLMSADVQTRVIDADPHEAVKPSNVTPPQVNHTIPLNAQTIGIELDHQIVWPASVTCHDNVIDQQSLADALKTIKKTNNPLLIGVAAHRLPDRGVQRIIKELIENTNGVPWLMLLYKQSATPVENARKLAWFRLAEACGISAEHVITQ
ncbi:MAG: DUF2868 domain-containing protein [Nitrosomonas sp.]|nr:DUF2868 domain-containing protein [Nitrosomonas sp.]MDP1950687.1 DUF2868 domain-containing protein [Nitrosomonas sp.]